MKRIVPKNLGKTLGQLNTIIGKGSAQIFPLVMVLLQIYIMQKVNIEVRVNYGDESATLEGFILDEARKFVVYFI